MPASTHRHLIRTRVYDGNLGNSAPEPLDGWTCQEIWRFANSRMDYAVLRRELKRQKETLTDMRCDRFLKQQQNGAPGANNQYVCVWEVDAEGLQVRPLFWGELLKCELMITPAGESLVATACLRDHHFGVPSKGQVVWDTTNNKALEIHLDPWFNPLVDGRIIGNMQGLLTHANSPGQLEVPYKLWIDPESTRTSEAEQQRGTGFSDHQHWTVREAVRTCCEYLNGAWFSQQIKNPVHGQNDAGYSNIEEPLENDEARLWNLRIRRGSHLPAILDAILKPFRYGWYVKLEDPDHTSELPRRQVRPRIDFYRVGRTPDEVNPAKQLKLQAADADVDPNKTNLISLTVTCDMSNTANIVHVFGSLKQREVTIPLFRGWPSSQDSASDTTLDGPNPNAWRKWVGNEGGDYKDLRTEIDDAIDLNAVFDNPNSNAFNYTIPKRRELEDPLKFRSGAEDMLRQPPFVEYSTNNGTSWNPVPAEWGWVLLINEIGIMFTGETVPPDLKAAGANAKLRITGTITGDMRIEHRAGKSGSEPVSDDVEIVVDQSHRFHSRDIVTTGTYQSKLSTDTNDGDEVDDETRIEEEAEFLRDESEHARLTLTAEVSDVITTYEIGDVLDEVDGRGLDLATKKDGSETQRYPQIQAIGYKLAENITHIEAAA